MSQSYEQVEVTSRGEWRGWLAANHADSPGIWLVTYKKAAGPERYVAYEEIVLEALAFGWIDGQARAVDDERSAQLLTPRKPKSGWSRPNKRRVEQLEAEGLMTDAGRRAIDIAKENGSWSALDDAENLIEPDELRAALDANPDARRHWDRFPPSARKAILAWISTAKKPETRERRVAETARLAAENVRVNQPKR
jgi:uncharacterized protein YdeI (YjbR/CyaY-like superfamily)